MTRYVTYSTVRSGKHLNIFHLDVDPVVAAQKMCLWRHLNKMPVESAQMLSTAINLQLGMQILPFYKTTHPNHPSTIWARESEENFLWVADHGLAICQCYTDAFGKRHNSQAIIELAKTYVDRIDFPQSGLTPFATAMPDEFIHDDPVLSYRLYYVYGKCLKKKQSELTSPEHFLELFELVRPYKDKYYG